MAKVPPAKIESYIANPPKDVLAALVYGPDTGLVSQRAEKLARWVVENPQDPFRSVDISDAMLKEHPSVIADEMAAFSFGGGKRLIRLRDAGNSVTNAIKSAMEIASSDAAEHCFLLVTAGDLKPGTLRKLFEGEKQLAAIACYNDDARSLHGIISQTLREKGKSFDNDVVAFMAEHCQGDRMVCLSEIEKLLLYVGKDTKNIRFADALTCVGQTTETTLDDICMAVASGNRKRLQSALNKSFNQGVMPIVILRSLQRFFTRVHVSVGHMQAGKHVDEAMKALYPPVFFKQAPAFKQVLMQWHRRDPKSLWNANAILYELELACKKTGVNAELVCSRGLLKIASMR